jgi:sec-independent protein translocase protein TatA
MFGLNPVELLIIGSIIVLLFGTKKLPELGSGLGQAINNFKKSFSEAQAIDVTPKKDEEKKDESPKV